MKHIATLILIFASLIVTAQKYPVGIIKPPIRTVFNGDSVVIMTTKQSAFFNKKIDDFNEKVKSLQTEKSELENDRKELAEKNLKLSHERDSLERELTLIKLKLEANRSEVDTLRETIKSMNYVIDTTLQILDSIQTWWLYTSVDNSLVYFNWEDSTIKVMDLSVYRAGVNDLNGNLRLIRRGNNDDFEFFKIANWQLRESPPLGWDNVIFSEKRPVIYTYPFAISFRHRYIEQK